MKTFVNVIRELAGLFVDDGSLALAISVVVAFASLLAAIVPATPVAAGIALLAGCLGVLFANAMRAGR